MMQVFSSETIDDGGSRHRIWNESKFKMIESISFQKANFKVMAIDNKRIIIDYKMGNYYCLYSIIERKDDVPNETKQKLLDKMLSLVVPHCLCLCRKSQ